MKPLTKKVAKRAIRWYRKRMRLRDWGIAVEVHDDPPKWWENIDSYTYAAVKTAVQDHGARIWVSNARCLAKRVCPLVALFHECEHVRGARDGTEDHSVDCATPLHKEFSNNCVGAVLAALYRKEKRNA